ncbi:MAG: rhodanese family protein [Alphaproteobacteria bacterium]
MLTSIDAETAARMVEDGAVLVDIRDADERARAHIPGSEHRPLETLKTEGLTADGRPVIFHCRSGMRTKSNADVLFGCTGTEGADLYMVEGGLEAWRRAGLAIAQNRRQPIEIMRQVQITAGTLIVLGALLGWQVHPGFYALSAFVGAGLAAAGVTGSCLMARLLSFMPWNRASA